MGYFDDEKNVEEYIRVAEGHDGALLIDALKKLAPAGASVLELGFGAGKDLELLSAAGFLPTGSDFSRVFVERYRKGGGRFPVHQLDARTLDIDESFDVIYSNKVLHSLTEDELTTSLTRQLELLHPGGVLLHSFWSGSGSESYDGMHVQSYERESFEACLPERLGIVDFQSYAEMAPDDSFWAALRQI